jgi:hypothetical protein
VDALMVASVTEEPGANTILVALTGAAAANAIVLNGLSILLIIPVALLPFTGSTYAVVVPNNIVLDHVWLSIFLRVLVSASNQI